MEEGTWVEYGTPGTTTLSHEDIERAIARLEQFWYDAISWARICAELSPQLDAWDTCVC